LEENAGGWHRLRPQTCCFQAVGFQQAACVPWLGSSGPDGPGPARPKDEVQGLNWNVGWIQLTLETTPHKDPYRHVLATCFSQQTRG